MSLLGALAVAGAEKRTATSAELLLSAEVAAPGETVLAGVRLKMEPKWHTYWRNPGESGMATSIEWTLPAGVKAGEVQWPAPVKYTVEDITTYVHSDEVMLLVPLAVEKNAAPGPREISAKVSWLECDVNCVPGDASVKGKFNIGGTPKPSAQAGLLATWQGRIPKPNPRLQARAWWEGAAQADRRNLDLEWTALTPGVTGDFYPYENGRLEFAGKTEVVAADQGKIHLRKQVKKTEGQWPEEIAGLVIEKAGEGKAAAYEARLRLGGSPAPNVTPGGTTTPLAATGPASPKREVSLWLMFGLAFLGGLILNVMPCVLPVIALKILGFVNQSREEPGRVRKLGLIYAVGVLASFLVLAGVVVGVQLAGRKASWGMQFGNPVFIVLLTVLVTLVALNLFGLFEVMLGGRAMDAAAEVAGREGAGGAFFNGVLATALATPCTAPFLGAALGLAFTQPPLIVLLVFLTVGAGLASPYVLLSWNPGWLKLLPKPGAWMEKFKIAMGFPMLGTAVWLASLAQNHYGKRTWWLGVFLVVLALCAWMYGEFVQRGRKRRGLAGAIIAILLAGSYAIALEKELQWRSPVENAPAGVLQEGPDGIAWRPWSREAVARGRAEGRPVFVDFTADWCVTCQANKKTSIEIPSVRAKLKEMDAIPLLGDYTKVPTAITEELSRFGRAGVPLVMVYPRDTNAPPIVLPELLTPAVVLNALERAAQR